MEEFKKINPESLRIPTKEYSQGILIPAGEKELLFISGQLAQDINGNVVAPGNAEKQTETIFYRIGEILKDAQMDFKNIVKIQIFLKNTKDIKVVSNIRDQFLKDIRPASLMVVVSDFVKEGCVVEIEGIAVKSKNI